ncbi:MAG: urate hydroxylase PuuD [Gammaproteobacteria bacterium]|nr:urate hydroxylase PuuD [Gammaproteobacteria bacterium]
MNPLKTVSSALITGIILMVIMSLLLPGSAGSVSAALASVDRWLHIVSGVFWIGLLYYFNVVQIPGLAAGLADKGGPGNAGIVKYIAPRALLWFRWGAVVTVISGVFLMEFTYGGGGLMKGLMFRSGFETIGIGAWLGIIMFLNVWLVIWPNQKKVIGVVQATDEQKAAARSTATLASRVNFVLSIPMLMAMGGQSHGLPF